VSGRRAWEREKPGVYCAPLPPCCCSEHHKEVLELEYRVCLLELEKAELDQSRLLYERVMSQVRRT
jgi:hypothetical protein